MRSKFGTTVAATILTVSLVTACAPLDSVPRTDLQSYADALCYGNDPVFLQMSSNYVAHEKQDWLDYQHGTRCVGTTYEGSIKDQGGLRAYEFEFFYKNGDDYWQEYKILSWDGKYVTDVREIRI